MNRDAQLQFLTSRNNWHEGPNNGNPFGPWQGVGDHAAWCDSFAQEGAVEAGGFRWQPSCQCGVKGDAYTPWTVKHAQELGIWQPASWTPYPGAQILFSWNRNGVADHIGTVIQANADGTITCIEGNCHDQVMYTRRDRTYVLGFVALPIDSAAPAPAPGPAPAPAPAPAQPGWPGRYLHIGLKGGDVQTLQHGLNNPGKVGGSGYHLAEDGDFGPATKNAVQDYQHRHGLQVDGVVGPQTWARLFS